MKEESDTSTIGHINLNKKLLRKRSAGNLHAAFDEAGDGNGVYKTTAPSLDPTGRYRINGYGHGYGNVNGNGKTHGY